MRPTPTKSQRASRKESRPNTFVLVVVFPIVLFLVLALWNHFQVTTHLVILVLIFIFISVYAIVSDMKRQLEPDEITVKFKDNQIFQEEFVQFMNNIGFNCHQTEDNIYSFDIKPRSHIRFAGLSFPPKSWGYLRMEVHDTSATIFGPKYPLSILKGMIKHQLIEENIIQLPY